MDSGERVSATVSGVVGLAVVLGAIIGHVYLKRLERLNRWHGYTPEDA
jgi:hypothetical protein